MAALVAALAACSDDTTDPSSINDFYAIVNGASERPPVSTNASGTATFSYNGTSITFTVNYSGLSGAPTASHIHRGGPTTASGAAELALCGAGGAPNCPTTASGSFTGTADASNLLGSATMAGVVDAMRGFGAYVNIHTAANTGGEIRGNIVNVQ